MARQPTLTFFYQFNPWQSTIGGIQTLIRYYIKYAPPEFNLRLVGTSTDTKEPLGQWQETTLEGHPLQFLPLCCVPEDNVRQRIPTSVRYTLALRGKDWSSDFMHFHRLEPSLMTRHWQGFKTLFIHNDIHQQIQNPAAAQNAILWKRFPWLYFALERRLLGQFQQILSCNSDAVDFYRRQYPQWASRIQIVRNTVDPEQFYPLSPPEKERQRQALALEMGLPPETRFLLFAGRLHPQKDPLLLVQAIAELQMPNVHLLIAGAGELMEPLRIQIQSLGLDRTITLLGAVALDALARLHRLSSAVVLTSAYEGLPLVVLEALASGTPVVTTNCGETPRFLVAGSGLVCQDRSSRVVAAALREVLQNPAQFSTQACTAVAKPFFVGHVVGSVYGNMYQIWEETLRLRQGRSCLDR